VDTFPALLDLNNLAIVLVSPRNPLNIGAVARAMTNFGCRDLRLVQVHPPSLEDARSAVGPSAELVANAKEFATVADAIADCIYVAGTVAPFHRPPSESYVLLPGAVPAIRAYLAQGRVALLFGPEKTGLSNDVLSHCQQILSIPTTRTLASMNLGQAAAVCLYELSRADANTQNIPASAEAEPPAAAADFDRITALLIEALTAADYTAIDTATAQREIRQLTRRLQFNEPDAQTLTGMLRKILYRLRPPSG
jgi:tRNA/rRNA methyltransferase